MTDNKKPLTIGVIGTGRSAMETIAALNGKPLPEDQSAEIKKPVTLQPLIKGKHGQAWQVNLTTLRKKLGVDPAKDAGLAHWIIEAPWAHPVWHSYVLVLIHLRPLVGFEKPHLYLDCATHEL